MLLTRLRSRILIVSDRAEHGRLTGRLLRVDVADCGKRAENERSANKGFETAQSCADEDITDERERNRERHAQCGRQRRRAQEGNRVEVVGDEGDGRVDDQTGDEPPSVR